MTNLNGDADSSINDPSAAAFFDWQLQLDYDDEEFRAGYPFTDIPELHLNENSKSYDPSSINNLSHQLNHSSSDSSISITYEDNQIKNSAYGEPMDVQLEFDLGNSTHQNEQIHSNEINGYCEKENDDDHSNDESEDEKDKGKEFLLSSEYEINQ